MAQILLKRSSVAGAVPTSSQLALGEIAINTADGKIFIKDSNGSILTFSKAADFAAAVHSHAISDVTGLQAALDALTTAASDAQAGADASLKIASNLSDLNNAGTARTNLDVYSKSEVDSAVSSAQSAAELAASTYTDQKISDLIAAAPGTLDTLKEIADAIQAGSDVATGLASSIGAVSDRVTTLEGQNLDSRITDAQADADAAQSTADSALKKADNLSDLQSASTARTNLDVYSKGEADSAISTAVSAAETALQGDIDGIDSRVTTLEGQNLGSRLTTAEGAISTLQSDVVAAQSAADAAQADADAAQSTADSAVTAAATAQSGADASLKIASNLSDISSASAARTNLSVDSSAEVDSKISTAVSAAQTALENDLNTLEGRVDTAESNISTLQTDVVAAQSTADQAVTDAASANSNAEGRASKSANLSDLASVSTARTNLSVDSSAEVDAKITAALEVLDGGTFSGFNGGGGGGGSTPVIGAYFYAGANANWSTLANWYGDSVRTQDATALPDATTDVTLQSNASANMDSWTQPQSINVGAFALTLTSTANPSANLTCSVSGTGSVTLNGVAFNR